jgi:redox-sensitive bicupin YhaK (pirin superfamily)
MAFSRRDFLGASALAVVGCVEARPTANVYRAVERILPGVPTVDGAGVQLTRIIGQPSLPDLDPFLLLDRIHSDVPGAYIAGFPDHPHRGFETVSVMLDGAIRHRDSRGNSGLIKGGGIQWMTAGRGIVHSEMPEQERGLLSGFQLWVNLPKVEKMCAPYYQDLGAERIAVADLDRRGSARVIAGDLFGVRGPVRPRPSAPMLATLRLDAGQALELPLPADHTAFLFVHQGSLGLGAAVIRADELAVLGPGDRLALEAGSSGAAFVFAAGRPFREPIVRYGPFAMNTKEEIERAIDDYRRGILGRDG